MSALTITSPLAESCPTHTGTPMGAKKRNPKGSSKSPTGLSEGRTDSLITFLTRSVEMEETSASKNMKTTQRVLLLELIMLLGRDVWRRTSTKMLNNLENFARSVMLTFTRNIADMCNMPFFGQATLKHDAVNSFVALLEHHQTCVLIKEEDMRTSVRLEKVREEVATGSASVREEVATGSASMMALLKAEREDRQAEIAELHEQLDMHGTELSKTKRELTGRIDDVGVKVDSGFEQMNHGLVSVLNSLNTAIGVLSGTGQRLAIEEPSAASVASPTRRPRPAPVAPVAPT